MSINLTPPVLARLGNIVKAGVATLVLASQPGAGQQVKKAEMELHKAIDELSAYSCQQEGYAYKPYDLATQQKLLGTSAEKRDPHPIRS